VACRETIIFPQASQQRPVIVGFGPCGIIAALLLAQMGLKPVVIERGQDARQRTKDTRGLWRGMISENSLSILKKSPLANFP